MSGVLAGCSLLDSVTSTLSYTEAASTYVQDATNFAEQAPQMAEQVIKDNQAVADFVQELETMKEKVVNFNGLDAPAFAQDVHQQLLTYNEIFLNEINQILEQINANVIDWQAIRESGMWQTATDIAEVMQLLQQLGG
jgi:hypothetical protein